MKNFSMKIISFLCSFIMAASPAVYAATMSGTVSYDSLWSDVVVELEEALLDFDTEVSLNFGSYDVVSTVSDSEVNDSNFTKYSAYYGGDTSDDSDEIKAERKIAKIAVDLLWDAAEHNGDPDEGDYLLYTFKSCDYSYEQNEDGDYIFTFSDIEYLMTAKQSKSFKNAAQDLIEDNGWDEMSTDYEVVVALYDYLTDFKYSSVVSSGGDYQFTAYGLYTYGSGSFSAFAQFGYYVLNYLGIDARIVSNGGSHSWLIIELSGYYYHFDPAYALKEGTSDDYTYLLLGSSSISDNDDFELSWQYETTSFTNSYSISKTDYVPSDVTLSDEGTVILAVGDTYSLGASDSASRTLAYSSSDESVATVSSSGNVTAVSVGEAVITASAGESSASCTILVVEEKTVSVSANSVDSENVSGGGTYKYGDTVTLSAEEYADGYIFSYWTISGGTLLSDSMYSANISFVMPDEDVEVIAIYEKIPISSITVSASYIEIVPDGTFEVTYSYEPENAIDDIEIGIKDESIATYEDGVVTGVSDGTTYLIFSSQYSGVSVSVPVTVSTNIFHVESTVYDEEGNATTERIEVTAGETVTLTTADAEDAGYVFSKWTVSPTPEYTDDTTAADLTISFIMPYSSVTAIASYTEVKPNYISVSSSNIVLEVGDTYDLSPSVYPENAVGEMTITSSDEDIVYVSSDGVLTAMSPGSAKIVLAQGNVRKVVIVTVEEVEEEYVEASVSSLSIYVGDEVELSIDTNSDTLEYETSDDDVATVSDDGVVTGIAEGSAKITITGEEGTEDIVKVVVSEEEEYVKISESSISIDVGETYTLTVSSNSDDVEYTSSDTGVATVSSKGVVEGIAEGTATITAEGEDGATDTVSVTVSGEEDEDSDSSSVEDLYNAANIYKMNADTTKILSSTWSSSNTDYQQSASYISGTSEVEYEDGIVTAVIDTVAISIAADDDFLSEISAIKIEQIDISVDMDGYSVGAAYDITPLDSSGNEIEPDETVTVSLSGDGITQYTLSGNTKLIHIVDGEYEEIEMILSDSGSITFSTDSFSIYAIMTEDFEETDESAGSSYSQVSSAATGDHGNLYLYVMVFLISATGFGFLTRKWVLLKTHS